ncbi:MAG: LysE family transporter [Rubrivivax sp.]|jgi:homoserine/homoserine lactone efflux protein|nr:LysE family transporter [Rubrivivax sp.]
MELQTWLIYLLATTGLSLSPGPNSLLALTHGALHGWRRTLFTIAGGAVGFVVLIGLSLFGIGALLKASPMGLVALKWVGGAYLVWLGVQVWRSPPIGASLGASLGAGLGSAPATGLGANAATDAAGPSPTGGALAWQGALAALTNPKGVLFFAAFLPQFVDPERSLWLQFAVMAGTFAVIETLTELGIAATAARLRPWLDRVGQRFNQVCGGLFMLIGAALPLRG